jgi:excisionase family DNA binding protein
MNVNQVAIYTGLKVRTIRDYVYKGKIPHIKINKMVRFDKAKIDKWIDGFYSSEP